LEEVVVPPVGILVAVVFTREFVGPVVAGVVYLVLLGVVLLGIVSAARHWNIRYMAGFLVSGIVLLGMAPSVVSDLIHPIFGALGTLLVVVFLVAMVLLFVEKSGLSDLFGDL